MSYISATVDIGDVEQGLDAMQRRARTLGPAFEEIKVAMKADQKEHREQEQAPEGKWLPRKLSTIAAERRHHKGRLVPRKILGKLPTAATYKALGYAAIAESRIRWSLSQQDGGTVGRGVHLVARTFLWISDKLLDTSTDIIGRKLLGAYGGQR